MADYTIAVEIPVDDGSIQRAFDELDVQMDAWLTAMKQVERALAEQADSADGSAVAANEPTNSVSPSSDWAAPVSELEQVAQAAEAPASSAADDLPAPDESISSDTTTCDTASSTVEMNVVEPARDETDAIEYAPEETDVVAAVSAEMDTVSSASNEPDTDQSQSDETDAVAFAPEETAEEAEPAAIEAPEPEPVIDEVVTETAPETGDGQQEETATAVEGAPQDQSEQGESDEALLASLDEETARAIRVMRRLNPGQKSVRELLAEYQAKLSTQIAEPAGKKSWWKRRK